MERSPEVLVVGAGVVGSATAYFARSRHQSDARRRAPASVGSVGAKPGYVWTHTRAEGVRRWSSLSRDGALYDELVDALDDFEFRASGGMIYFFEDGQDLFPRFVEGRNEGRDTGRALRRRRRPERCVRSCRTTSPVRPTTRPMPTWIRPSSRRLSPRRRSGRCHDHARKVTALRMEGGRCVGVETDGGSVFARAGRGGSRHVGLRNCLRHSDSRCRSSRCACRWRSRPRSTCTFDPILYGHTAVKQYALTKELPGYDEEAFLHPLETIFPGLAMLELAAQRPDGRVLLGCPMDFVGMQRSSDGRRVWR